MRGVGGAHVGRDVQGEHLALVRGEGDVHLHQGPQELGCCGFGQSLKQVLWDGLSEVDMGRLVLSHGLAEVLNKHLDGLL